MTALDGLLFPDGKTGLDGSAANARARVSLAKKICTVER
jgi:hypothetical protein